jgi:hypothetical protein
MTHERARPKATESADRITSKSSVGTAAIGTRISLLFVVALTALLLISTYVEAGWPGLESELFGGAASDFWAPWLAIAVAVVGGVTLGFFVAGAHEVRLTESGLRIRKLAGITEVSRDRLYRPVISRGWLGGLLLFEDERGRLRQLIITNEQAAVARKVHGYETLPVYPTLKDKPDKVREYETRLTE